MKKFLIFGIFILLLVVLFSGCTEEKSAEEYNCLISAKITNLASNDIFANIEVIGEGYTYNKKILIKTGETNITGFGSASDSKNLEDIDIKIIVSYVNLPNIIDTISGSYGGYGFHFNYKVYGSIVDNFNAVIDIQGPVLCKSTVGK